LRKSQPSLHTSQPSSKALLQPGWTLFETATAPALESAPILAGMLMNPRVTYQLQSLTLLSLLHHATATAARALPPAERSASIPWPSFKTTGAEPYVGQRVIRHLAGDASVFADRFGNHTLLGEDQGSHRHLHLGLLPPPRRHGQRWIRPLLSHPPPPPRPGPSTFALAPPSHWPLIVSRRMAPRRSSSQLPQGSSLTQQSSSTPSSTQQRESAQPPPQECRSCSLHHACRLPHHRIPDSFPRVPALPAALVWHNLRATPQWLCRRH
jgi:hypothetical protein